jgi:hypothetical protein
MLAMVRLPLFRTEASWWDTIRAAAVACLAVVVASFISNNLLAVLLIVAGLVYAVASLRPRRR